MKHFGKSRVIVCKGVIPNIVLRQKMKNCRDRRAFLDKLKTESMGVASRVSCGQKCVGFGRKGVSVRKTPERLIVRRMQDDPGRIESSFKQP